MSDEPIKRTEKVSVEYRNGKITIIGTSFALELDVSTTELSKVYWGSKGSGISKLLVRA